MHPPDIALQRLDSIQKTRVKVLPNKEVFAKKICGQVTL